MPSSTVTVALRRVDGLGNSSNGKCGTNATAPTCDLSESGCNFNSDRFELLTALDDHHCSTTTTKQCLTNADCPGGQTCVASTNASTTAGWANFTCSTCMSTLGASPDPEAWNAFGATVVRVESESHPDGLRSVGPFPPGKTGYNVSGYFNNYNAGKLDLTLNLNTDLGKKMARKLIAWCDIFITNHTPRVLERWHLEYDDVREINPTVIAAYQPMQGFEGPHKYFMGFGAVLGPQDSWLVLRGLKTLKVRMEESQRGAVRIAAWLAEQKRVTNIFFPGLPGHPGHAVHNRQSSGPGAVLSFTLESYELTKRLLEQAELPAFAVSLGGVESILSYPARMSHAAMPPAERAARGITDTLIRLSVGLEDPDDLIADMDRLING